jgi:hypothetical protein
MIIYCMQMTYTASKRKYGSSYETELPMYSDQWQVMEISGVKMQDLLTQS